MHNDGSVTRADIAGTAKVMYGPTTVTLPIIFEVSSDSRGVGPVVVPALGTAMVTEMLLAADSPSSLRGVSTGSSDLDAYLRGMLSGSVHHRGGPPVHR